MNREEDAPAATGKKRRLPIVAALMLGLFLAIGALATVAVLLDWLQKLETHSWRPARCTITESTAVYRPEVGDHLFTVRYRYRARGEEHLGSTYRHGYGGSETEGKARVLASRYPVGLEVDCWVDPDEPARSALRRGNLWKGLWIFVPLVFVAVGAGGLWLLRHPAPWRRLADQPAGANSEKGRPAAKPGLVAGFFALFLVFGLLFLVPFFLWPLYRIAEARTWKPTPCEIVSASVRTHQGDDGATYSVEVLYRYEVSGREYLSDRYHFLSGSSSGYEGKAEIVASLAPGSRTICYVDPEDPSQAVLHRGLSPDLLFGLIPLVFVVVGAGGTWAALWTARGARRAAERPSWPAAPPTEAAAGAIELEPATGPVGKLAVATVFAVIWNGIIAVFVWQVLETWQQGRPDWLLILFLTPFVLVGLLLAIGVPYAALALLNPRPRLRLSRAVLRPGESAQVDWSFRGSAGRIERLTLRLAGYGGGGGGSKAAASEPFQTVEIAERRRGFGLEYGAATLTVPTDAPASGGDGETGVAWKLELHGDIPFWPDVEERFEIEVLPAHGSAPGSPATSSRPD